MITLFFVIHINFLCISGMLSIFALRRISSSTIVISTFFKTWKNGGYYKACENLQQFNNIWTKLPIYKMFIDFKWHSPSLNQVTSICSQNKTIFFMNFMYPNVILLALFFSPKNDPICYKYRIPCVRQLNLSTLLWILNKITSICDVLPILCAINAN